MNLTHRAYRRAGLVLGLLLSLLSVALMVAGPASADTVYSYTNGYLGNSYYLSSTGKQAPAKVEYGYDNWSVQQISDSPSKHVRVFLKSGGLCLDSHAAKNGGAAWTVSCNGGDYQIWEVFYQSNGSRVFKGWGSYTKQGLNLCVSSSGTTAVTMVTCNVANSRQQWYATYAAGQ